MPSYNGQNLLKEVILGSELHLNSTPLPHKRAWQKRIEIALKRHHTR